jgi:hypothetical protein
MDNEIPPLQSFDEFQSATERELAGQKPLHPITPVSLKGLHVPVRDWIVPEWVPCGVVTGLYGDGGLGKSLIAQQLQTALALGSAWLALPVEAGATLGVYCEDSRDELWRRQADINTEYEVDFDALSAVHWLPRLGEDNLVIAFPRNGVGELTPFHSQVLEAALDVKARLVVVDTAADVFGGNENDRSQVRQFISRALDRSPRRSTAPCSCARIRAAAGCPAAKATAGLPDGQTPSDLASTYGRHPKKTAKRQTRTRACLSAARPTTRAEMTRYVCAGAMESSDPSRPNAHPELQRSGN